MLNSCTTDENAARLPEPTDAEVAETLRRAATFIKKVGWCQGVEVLELAGTEDRNGKVIGVCVSAAISVVVSGVDCEDVDSVGWRGMVDKWQDLMNRSDRYYEALRAKLLIKRCQLALMRHYLTSDVDHEHMVSRPRTIGSYTVSWNDAPDRTADDVLMNLRECADELLSEHSGRTA